MPVHEQLALIGESDNQMHFTSETWGLLTFFPSKTNKIKDTCQKCLLRDSDECNSAPSSDFQRYDQLEGYFSIHEMPTLPEGGAK